MNTTETKSPFATFSETENKVLTTIKSKYKTEKKDGLLNYCIEYLRKETTNKQTSEVPVLLTNAATLKQLTNEITTIANTVFAVKGVKTFTMIVGGEKQVTESNGVKYVNIVGGVKLHIDKTTFTIGKGKALQPMNEGQVYNKFIQMCFASFDSELNLEDVEIFASYFITCAFNKALPKKYSVLKHAFDVSNLIQKRISNQTAKQNTVNVNLVTEAAKLEAETKALNNAVSEQITLLLAPAKVEAEKATA